MPLLKLDIREAKHSYNCNYVQQHTHGGGGKWWVRLPFKFMRENTNLLKGGGRCQVLHSRFVRLSN